MTPLYQESPVMFPAEPLRFIATIAIAAAGIVVAFLFGWALYPGLVVAALALLTLGWWAITNRSTLVTVDEDRVTYRRGVFNKEHIEVELASVRTVRVDQSLVDRIFGCGKMTVISAGDLADIVQDGLPDVNRLRAALRTAQDRT